jgi:hypothetical protein
MLRAFVPMLFNPDCGIQVHERTSPAHPAFLTLLNGTLLGRTSVDMNLGGNARHFLIALGLALAAYGACFWLLQHRRVANGPWEVAFTSESGMPVLVVKQGALGIGEVRLVFPGQSAPAHARETVRFALARPVPFDLPFGECVFLDPLFLPGTVVLEAFGHQIQLMPRVLTIDRVERAWHSGETILLTNATTSTPRLP